MILSGAFLAYFALFAMENSKNDKLNGIENLSKKKIHFESPNFMNHQYEDHLSKQTRISSQWIAILLRTSS